MCFQRQLRKFAPEALVLAVIGLLTLLVWPVGNYVVDDDWAFSWSLMQLVELGRIEILEWNPMTLVGHLAWGWIFAAPAGVDSAHGLTLAKLSTVTLLCVESMALMAVLRQVGVAAGSRAIAGLALVLSPVHFFQSFLYATDIPALAWSTLAFLGYTRGLSATDKPRMALLLLASLSASMAFAVRQSSILVLGALGLYLLLFERKQLRDPRIWLGCFAVPVLCVVAIQTWYSFVHEPTAAYERSFRQILAGLSELGPNRLAYFATTLLSYIALPLVPICLATSLEEVRALWRALTLRSRLVSTLSVTSLFLWAILYRERLFPFIHNKLTRFGFLSPGELIVGAREPLWSEGWALGITLLLGGVAVLAVWRMASASTRDSPTLRTTTARMAALWLGLLAAYALVSYPIAFDRHFIVFAPVVLIVWFSLEARPESGADAPRASSTVRRQGVRPSHSRCYGERSATQPANRGGARMPVHLPAGPLGANLPLSTFRAALILLPLALYDTVATQEIHAFSRASSQLARGLLEHGVPAHDIDAGYAFDGYHNYLSSWPSSENPQPDLRARTGGEPIGADPWYVRAVTPAVRTRYVVSLSRENERARYQADLPYWAHRFTQPDLRRYQLIEKANYARLWPLSPGSIYVLEEVPSASQPAGDESSEGSSVGR